MTEPDWQDHFLAAVRDEYVKARKKHAPMHSGHEGYAVLLEEVEELWDDVKADRVGTPNAIKECIQIAAMAMAFFGEVCAPASGESRAEEPGR